METQQKSKLRRHQSVDMKEVLDDHSPLDLQYPKVRGLLVGHSMSRMMSSCQRQLARILLEMSLS